MLNYFTQIKKLKSLKLVSNNICEYLELVKFEIFSSLVNITIESNPISDSCMYLRQFAVYRFNHLRYFNRKAIDYGDLQKAKQVFNSFDKILQIPGQVTGKKKNAAVKNTAAHSRSIADGLLDGAISIVKASKEFNKAWLEVCQEMIK